MATNIPSASAGMSKSCFVAGVRAGTRRDSTAAHPPASAEGRPRQHDKFHRKACEKFYTGRRPLQPVQPLPTPYKLRAFSQMLLYQRTKAQALARFTFAVGSHARMADENVYASGLTSHDICDLSDIATSRLQLSQALARVCTHGLQHLSGLS